MGEVSAGRAAEALTDLAGLDLHRHAHLDFLTRAWKLRDNITAYDAMYVALAEALDASVVTCDEPLSRAPGHRAKVELFEQGRSLHSRPGRQRRQDTTMAFR